MIRRRGFLKLAGGSAGLLAVPLHAGGGHAPSVLLFDPALPLALRYARLAGRRGIEVRAVAGDRVRLARALMREEPGLIEGMTSWADCLLLAGTAEEAGYRLAGRPVQRGTAVLWAVRRRG